MDGQESLENYSRRNNIKVFGIPEKDTNNGSDPEVWEECEAAVKNEIHTKLKINPESMVIERAHRVGKRRDPFHHLADGTKVESRPRPIVAKFLSWKDKDPVLRSARSIKPDGVQFLEDFSKRTLDKRKEKIPELIAARKSGKRAFLVMDKIMVKLMNSSKTVVRLRPEISAGFYFFTVVFFLFFSHFVVCYSCYYIAASA